MMKWEEYFIGFTPDERAFGLVLQYNGVEIAEYAIAKTHKKFERTPDMDRDSLVRYFKATARNERERRDRQAHYSTQLQMEVPNGN